MKLHDSHFAGRSCCRLFPCRDSHSRFCASSDVRTAQIVWIRFRNFNWVTRRHWRGIGFVLRSHDINSALNLMQHSSPFESRNAAQRFWNDVPLAKLDQSPIMPLRSCAIGRFWTRRDFLSLNFGRVQRVWILCMIRMFWTKYYYSLWLRSFNVFVELRLINNVLFLVLEITSPRKKEQK